VHTLQESGLIEVADDMAWPTEQPVNGFDLPSKHLIINPEPITSTLTMGRPVLRVVSGGASPEPDLKAIAALRAKLWEAGYRPLAIYSHDHPIDGDRAGKAPIGDDWGERALRNPPEATVARPERKAANTGVLCRGLRPVDGDIDSPELAERVYALALEKLGPAPIRFREGSSRKLLVYRAASGTPKKREITGATHVPKVHGCKVEILGDGQQFVAYGTHPSGAELEWTQDLATVPLASLTAVTEAQIDEFEAAAALIIGAKSKKKEGPGDDADTADIVDIVAAFKVIPNNAPADWDNWVAVGLAAWVGSSASLQGFAAWDEWSSRHPDYDAKKTRERWEHFSESPPDRTGANKLFKLAKDAVPGWRRPSEFGRASQAPSAVVPFNPWDALQPPAFPMHAVPPILKAFVEDEAEIIGADPCALTWSAISACSAAIDARIRLRMRTIGNWFAPPMIWVALVGGPSTKKTPIIRSTWSPLEREQQVDLIEWEKQKAAYAQLSKKERDDNPKPRCKRRLVTNNATPEAIQELLGFQHRGIGVLHDELAGWIGAQEKYTSGKGRLADRAFWLQSFDGGPYVVDRVEAGRGTSALSNLSVTVCGGIQPDRLRGMTDLTDDGLWQRFAPIIVAPARMSQEGDFSNSRRDYRYLVRYLLKLDPKTQLVLSDDARPIFEEVERRVFELEQSDVLGPRFVSFCGKLTGLWGRLALVLNLMSEWATPHIVSWDAAEAARILLFESLLPSAARIYADMGGAGGNAEATQSIAGFILVKQKHRVMASDLTRNVRVCRGLTLEEVQKRVSPLVAGGWLTPEDDFNPSAWHVNSAVHTVFAERAQQQAEQRARMRDLITGSIDTDEEREAA
jgi:hypothetical protein